MFFFPPKRLAQKVCPKIPVVKNVNKILIRSLQLHSVQPTLRLVTAGLQALGSQWRRAVALGAQHGEPDARLRTAAAGAYNRQRSGDCFGGDVWDHFLFFIFSHLLFFGL